MSSRAIVGGMDRFTRNGYFQGYAAGFEPVADDILNRGAGRTDRRAAERRDENADPKPEHAFFRAAAK